MAEPELLNVGSCSTFFLFWIRPSPVLPIKNFSLFWISSFAGCFWSLYKIGYDKSLDILAREVLETGKDRLLLENPRPDWYPPLSTLTTDYSKVNNLK